MESKFKPFTTDISSIEVPKSFTFPFDYTPHTLAELASKDIMSSLEKLPPEIHDFSKVGKMFGVLVVKDQQNNLGYLTAFSGKLQHGIHYDYFVPPIFDMFKEEGFYRIGEEEINELNRQIKSLENDSELTCVLINYDRNIQDLEAELKEAKNTFKKGKTNRKAVRKELEINERIVELAAVKVAHEKESHYQQYVIKKLKEEIQDLITQKQAFLAPNQNELKRLKDLRKSRSSKIQQQLFEQYNFFNAKGEKKNVLDVFGDILPPGGTGECAAPKLLQFAYQHQLKPVCMSEFWWGISPPKEIRKQGEYYPACKRKCEPVLGFMLQGLTVDKNPRKDIEIEQGLETIFEDDHILVVNKPSEMLSAPGKIDISNVHDLIKAEYPNATGPLLVHRLDQSTSGILLIAKSKASHAILQRQFEERTVKKRYEAILDGIIEQKTGKIELPLRVDFDNRPRQLVCEEHGKLATTHYKVVGEANNQTRIHFFPVTGRTHQLRVHAAHQLGLNTPIWGDDLYGKRANRLHLHAAQLTFTHPITLKEVTFNCKVPF